MPPPVVVLRAVVLLLASPSAAANVFSGAQAPPAEPEGVRGLVPDLDLLQDV